MSSVPLEKLIRANDFFNFKVGVNGYGFAINNNGFVLFHPGLDREVIALHVLFSCLLLSSGDSDHSGRFWKLVLLLGFEPFPESLLRL